jgi:hypothetical protein
MLAGSIDKGNENEGGFYYLFIGAKQVDAEQPVVHRSLTEE